MPQQRDNISGLLLLDKPQGVTSNQALQEVKYLLNAKKAGHAGSLDPLATGLLPLCFGEATKLSSYLLDADKTYTATFKLGQTTTTYDSEGEITQVREVDFTPKQLHEAMASFVGSIDQVPPMYSALKKDGKPLYKLARQGLEVAREPRRKQLHAFELLASDDDEIRVLIRCSSGFYVRSLAQDLGEVLNCGAHVCELRRVATKQLVVDQAVTLKQLQDMPDAASRQQYLQPADQVLNHLQQIILNTHQIERLYQGQTVSQAGLPAKGLVRVYSQSTNQFIGIGLIVQGHGIKPKRLVNPNSLKQS